MATVAAVSLVIVVATLAGVAGHVGYATSAESAVGDVVQRPAYDDVQVVSVGVKYAGRPTSEPRMVSVVLSRPASSDVNGSHLASALSEHITAETGQSTRVDVRFQEYYRAQAAPDGSGAERRTFGRRLPSGHMNRLDRRPR